MMSRKLSQPRLQEIRNEASIVLKKVSYKSGFVDAVQCAEALQAVVKYAPYDDGELAGMLVRNHGEKAVIAVNSAHHPNRRRFTIAHEIGHLVLHDRDVHIDEKLSIRRHRDHISKLAIDNEEIDANQFAAELLMPLHSILQDMREIDLDVEDDTETELLARKYKVSTQAMTYRVLNLSAEFLFD